MTAAPKPATANTERSVERVKGLRAQIDRNPLAFAIQAERLEREHTKLVAALRDVLNSGERESIKRGVELLHELGES